MIKFYCRTLIATALLAATLSAAAENGKFDFGITSPQAIAKGQSEYVIDLTKSGIDIASIKSNQNVEVEVTLDKWDENVYTYKGVYAIAGYDEEGNIFKDGDFIKSPACNMLVNETAQTLSFGWSGITDSNWAADVSYWNYWIPEMQTGCVRLSVPEGIVTITDKAGRSYDNNAVDIIYEILGNYYIAKITDVTPSPKQVVGSLSEINFNFDFSGLDAKPAALSSEFMSSDFTFSYSAPGAENSTKIYDLKTFTYDSEKGAVNLSFKKSGQPMTYTEPGTYKLSANGGAFSFADAAGNKIAVTPGFEYTWTVEKPLAHFSRWEPAGSKINLDINDQGIASVIFTLKEGRGEIANDPNIFAKLYRDGKLIAQVPSNNYRLITYDSFAFDVWCLAFWEKPNGRATLPGKYTVEFPEGLLKVGDLPSEARTVEYVIDGNDYQINPQPGKVSSIKEVTFTWPEATSVALDTDNPDAAPFFYNMKGDTKDINFDYEISGNSITLIAEEAVTEPGKWEVGFSANAIILTYGEGESATTRTVSTNVGANYTIEAIPDVVPELQLAETVEFIPGTFELKITGDEIIGVVNNMEGVYIYPVNNDGSFGDYVARYQANKVDDKTMSLTNIAGKATTLYLSDGEYAIALPNKIFRLKGDNTYLDGITYYVNIKAKNRPYTVTPYDGKYLNEFTVAEFTFNEPVTIANAEPAFITDGVTSFLAGASIKEGDPNTVIYTASNPITISGTYELKAPAAAIKSAKANEKTKLVGIYDVRTSFTIVGEGEQLYIPAPQIEVTGSESHPLFTLTYPESGQINSELTPGLYKEVNGERELLIAYTDNEVVGNQVELHDGVTLAIEPGTYILVIPEGFYYTDTLISKGTEYIYKYEVESVDGISADISDGVTVYTFQGICVLRNAAPEKLAELPSGFYIVNGRKMIIRK
ncbi:MAG: hypothetical protein NC201_03905 [Prevotella sp.]|nr:hypothetical protein [Bacteroides sp.]MCM1366372.1 hypothetical protein [Prevotella sp.]MCM1436699.1 hypothetical protein [Prevotella sp.]